MENVIDNTRSTRECELFVESFSNINIRTYNEVTALHLASVYGTRELVEMLLRNGANVNARNKLGLTPLDCARDNKMESLLRQYGGKTGEELNAEESASKEKKVMP